ncbi:MAG: O-antigen ligase family protein, partial [Pseudomonadota bacterium]
TLALAVNNPNQVIEQVGSVGMEFLGGYAVGRVYIRDRSSFLALCRALIVIVLIMFPFALFETLTGRPLWLEALRALPSVKTVALNYQDPRILFGMTLERVQMGFAHPIHFGLFCSVAFSLCFVAMEGTFGTARRWLTAAVIACSGVLALSSGAILAIVLQFALILWSMMFASVEKRWWILLGLAVLAYITVDLLSNRTPVQVFMSYATFSAHTAYWRAIIFEWGMKNVWMNPWLGLGLNDWIRPWYMYSGSMDNFWLVMAVRYGIPGFLFVTVGYILIVFHVMRRNFRDDMLLTHFRRAWVFTFMGLTFTLCTVHVWTAIYSFTFFLLGAGVWLITAQTDDDGVDEEAAPANGRSFVRNFGGDARGPTTVTPAQDAKSVGLRFSRFGAQKAATVQRKSVGPDNLGHSRAERRQSHARSDQQPHPRRRD